jgi:sugar phosphate isomerase/epimerase
VKIPIAVQLYSVRDVASTDLLGTIARVAEMGYEGVEFAGYHGQSAEAIRDALAAAGIKAPSTHIALAAFEDDKFDATLEFHGTVGIRDLVIPWLPEAMHNSPESTLETAKMLSELTARVVEKGFRLGFHAHGQDMVVLEGGKSSYSILGENTPSDFIMQYDTANGMSAGADPVQPILEFPGRGMSVHLKEWSGEHGALIGDGEVPWSKVFEACESTAGTEWYVVEHEAKGGEAAMDDIRQCLVNLRGMGR